MFCFVFVRERVLPDKVYIDILAFASSLGLLNVGVFGGILMITILEMNAAVERNRAPLERIDGTS